MVKKTNIGQTVKFARPRPRGLILCALLVLVMLCLTGCPGKTIIKPAGSSSSSSATTTTTTTTTPPRPIPTDPKTAYELGDYVTAERLAAEWTSRPELSREDMLMAWQYYARAAVKNQHAHLAVTALNKWLEMEPAVDTTAPWQDTWLGAYALYPRQEARQVALELLQSQRNVALKNRGAMLLCLHYESTAELGRLLTYAQQMYQLLDQSNMALAERCWAGQLRLASSQQLQDLDGQAQLAANTAYPYILIRLETAFRMLADPASAQVGQGLLAQLQASAILADRSLLNPPPAEGAAETSSASAVSPLTMPVGSGQQVALLLPLGGAFAPISSKISAGAEVARQELERSGYTVQLTVINTEDPSWTQKLAALPKTTIIGGPLQSGAYAQAKTGMLLPGRALFAFLPQLDPGDEGRAAWRFYTSSKDQVDAVLTFCRDSLGITSVASLFPDDNYGQRMSDTFIAEATQLGMSVAKTQIYPAGNQEAWNNLAAGFLGVRKTDPPMDPKPGYDAVFIPDSWNNAAVMAAHLHYHMEDRQVLMGTTIWEQGLSKGQNMDAQYFNLGIFPSAWNYTSPTPGQQSLQAAMGGQASFWEALGYDFVRFASRLGAPDGEEWSAGMLNSRIASAQGMNWSMAQMQWDAGGQCRQFLYLYTPTQTSFAPVDPERFRSISQSIREQHAARMRGSQ